MTIHWAKESYGSLVDAHVSVLLFDTSLKTLGDLAYLPKDKKILVHWIFGSWQHMIQPRGESWEFFHYKLLSRYKRSNVKIFYINFIHSFNMICISRISLKLSKFLLDLLEYKTSFTWNLVSFGSIMFSFLEPSTKFVV